MEKGTVPMPLHRVPVRKRSEMQRTAGSMTLGGRISSKDSCLAGGVGVGRPA